MDSNHFDAPVSCMVDAIAGGHNDAHRSLRNGSPMLRTSRSSSQPLPIARLLRASRSSTQQHPTDQPPSHRRSNSGGGGSRNGSSVGCPAALGGCAETSSPQEDTEGPTEALLRIEAGRQQDSMIGRVSPSLKPAMPRPPPPPPLRRRNVSPATFSNNVLPSPSLLVRSLWCQW
jgi:hypothetical protein